jgi:hypothetical protein
MPVDSIKYTCVDSACALSVGCYENIINCFQRLLSIFTFAFTERWAAAPVNPDNGGADGEVGRCSLTPGLAPG